MVGGGVGCEGGQPPARHPTPPSSPLSSPRSSRRTWKPNAQTKALFSATLGASVRLRVTASALRDIDRAGGLDAYLLAAPPAALTSDIGEVLQAAVRAAKRRGGEEEGKEVE